MRYIIIIIIVAAALVAVVKFQKPVMPQIPDGITQEEHESHHPELYNNQ